jgi:hypothetical protein
MAGGGVLVVGEAVGGGGCGFILDLREERDKGAGMGLCMAPGKMRERREKVT